MTIAEFIAAKRKEGKRVAFHYYNDKTLDPNAEQRVVYCAEGERGFHWMGEVTNDPQGTPPPYCPNEAAAKALCKQLNEQLGLTEEEAHSVIISTMRPPQIRATYVEDEITIWLDGNEVLRLDWDDARTLATQLKAIGIKPKRR
jgi:hypothetical protein